MVASSSAVQGSSGHAAVEAQYLPLAGIVEGLQLCPLTCVPMRVHDSDTLYMSQGNTKSLSLSLEPCPTS